MCIFVTGSFKSDSSGTKQPHRYSTQDENRSWFKLIMRLFAPLNLHFECLSLNCSTHNDALINYL